MQEYSVKPIGFIRSELKNLEDAPHFYTEGAPNARLELLPAYWDGLERMQSGDEVILLTWLHLADREVLKVHPQGNPDKPLTGVFMTRSPDRPNPLGLHPVTVLEISGTNLRVGPIEAINGTPVVDIKPVLPQSSDS